VTLKRYGAGEKGAGGQPLPFARAVEANGWLYVSGQVAMENGEIVGKKGLGQPVAQVMRPRGN